MKGIVFTEFFDMIEEKFGYEMVDYLIENTSLSSDGIYTSVGTYSHSEMVDLVVTLSKKSGVEVDLLLKTFGEYLFNTFLESYPDFFKRVNNSFEFFESIDNYIHVEVNKLYPDADLPKFLTEVNGDQMTMTYISERKMSGLAEGLMKKSLEYFNEKVDVKKEMIHADGSKVKFILTK